MLYFFGKLWPPVIEKLVHVAVVAVEVVLSKYQSLAVQVALVVLAALAVAAECPLAVALALSQKDLMPCGHEKYPG